MKKILLILLCLPLIGFGQFTFVPDDNFEQALINLGYDNVLDDFVLMSSIDTVISLLVFNQNISDLTGIEDFVNLQILRCSGNQLTNMDLSNNSSLSRLFCGGNQITNLNLQNKQELYNHQKIVLFKQSKFYNKKFDYRFSIYIEPKIAHIITKLENIKI